jgi:hypothetical protein
VHNDGRLVPSEAPVPEGTTSSDVKTKNNKARQKQGTDAQTNSNFDKKIKRLAL